MRRVWAALACLCIFLVASVARAETILLVEDDDTKRFAVRVKAELVALGFEVDTIKALTAEASRASLEEAARMAGAAAAVRVRTSKDGVEVWILDRVTKKTVLREVVAGSSDDEGAVAVGVVELLRASLLEVDTPKFVPTDTPATPLLRSLVPPRVEPPKERWTSLVVAPALMASPGGLAPTVHMDVWGRFRASKRFVFGPRFVLPTLPATVEEREGRATITLASASMFGDFLIVPEGRPFGAHAGVGFGGVWAHMEGTASQSFVGRGDDVFAAFMFGHAGGSAAIGETVRLWLDASLGLSTPGVGVGFAGRSVAEWGQPALIASAGLQIFLF